MPERYPEEFRRKVLDLVAAGRPVAQIATDLGISDQTIYSWRRQELIDIGQLPGLNRAELAELTHLDTIHLAALSDTGKPLADAEFATRPAGYDVAVKWARSFGTVLRAGVEGTSSYGAGFTQALQDAGIEVADINRPDRTARRRQGKSDPLDAYAAARWPGRTRAGSP